jgi:outer membrane protein OmpA-like peptidoglycan-associated protein
MTLNLMRSLWLWAGVLTLALLAIVPLSTGLRTIAVLAVACLVILAWIKTGRLAARQSEALVMADGMALPSQAYRRPVVLVCGDGLSGLFGAVPVDQLAVRVTEQGCYLRVPELGQLSALAESILTARPDWRGQLSVMYVVNCAEHSDTEELAGRVRTCRHQITLIRKRGISLPLLLVSYLEAVRGQGPWFSWEADQASPSVRDADTCVSLSDWQRQLDDGATQALRLQTSVQLNAVADWLSEEVLPHFVLNDSRSSAGLAIACAVTLVPTLPQKVSSNLWQLLLRDKFSLIDGRQSPETLGAMLPFPDPLLHLLPVQNQGSPARRASVIALWLFGFAGVIALTNSAWQNNLLLRQVSDDLRRYNTIPKPDRQDQPEFAAREKAIAVLREDAERLDSYYRHGEPLALGLGLYHGERLRLPVLDIIARHRQPMAPAPLKTAKSVRLDSLSLFSTGSAELKTDSTKVLINALVDIKAQPGWLIVIAGHTDSTGNAENNLLLSRARAAAVRDWMRRMGEIPDSCFAVQGYGASQPVASNDTENGRAANRRVDIRLVPEVGACVLSTAGPD